MWNILLYLKQFHCFSLKKNSSKPCEMSLILLSKGKCTSQSKRPRMHFNALSGWIEEEGEHSFMFEEGRFFTTHRQQGKQNRFFCGHILTTAHLNTERRRVREEESQRQTEKWNKMSFLICTNTEKMADGGYLA